MNNLTAWSGHREAIRGLSFSPDDGRFATASDDSTIRIWSFEESREERVLTGKILFLVSTSRFVDLFQDTGGTSSASNGILARVFLYQEARIT